jgi:predicted Zn finger-like uncharacterized protein
MPQSAILRPRYGLHCGSLLQVTNMGMIREGVCLAVNRYLGETGEKTRCLNVALFTASLESFAPKDVFADPFSEEPSLESEIPAASDALIPEVALQTYTSCGNCRAAYLMTPEMLGPNGRRVKCEVCSNVWFQSADKLNTLRAGYSLEPFPVEQYKAGGMSRDGGRAPAGVVKHTRTGAVTLFVGNMPFSMTEEKIRCATPCEPIRACYFAFPWPPARQLASPARAIPPHPNAIHWAV